MPKFKYTIKNSKGETVTSEKEAYDKTSLVQELQNQGFFIMKIEDLAMQPHPPKGQVRGSKPTVRKFGHKKIKLEDLLGFARQLTTMLEAGVALLRSLEVITDQVESEKLHTILKKVTGDVEQGSSLSEALAQHPKVFNPFWVSLIEVGEASGTMPTVLNKLAFYLEQQAAFRSTIISAIMYPVILFIICMGAVAFFALFVGPRFESIFTSMGVELPLITKVLLSSFRFIKTNILKIFIVTVVAVFFYGKWSKTHTGKYYTERFFFGFPTLGRVYKLIIIERFTSQMAILVESGVPTLHALDITQRLVDNINCSNVVANIKESVRQGELLVGPMSRSGFFPSMAIQMITVGEETGELSKMLQHVADYYQSTVETFMKRLGTLIEPFMLVFMGAVIGIIVLAMFLPMFNIAQLGGGGGG